MEIVKNDENGKLGIIRITVFFSGCFVLYYKYCVLSVWFSLFKLREGNKVILFKKKQESREREAHSS